MIKGIRVHEISIFWSHHHAVMGPFETGAVKDGKMEGVSAHSPAHFTAIACFANFIAHLDHSPYGQGGHLAKMGVLGIGPERQAG